MSNAKSRFTYDDVRRLAKTGEVVYYAEYIRPPFKSRAKQNIKPTAVRISTSGNLCILVILNKDMPPTSKKILNFTLSGLFTDLESAIKYYEQRLAETEQEWKDRLHFYEIEFKEMKKSLEKLRDTAW